MKGCMQGFSGKTGRIGSFVLLGAVLTTASFAGPRPKQSGGVDVDPITWDYPPGTIRWESFKEEGYLHSSGRSQSVEVRHGGETRPSVFHLEGERGPTLRGFLAFLDAEKEAQTRAESEAAASASSPESADESAIADSRESDDSVNNPANEDANERESRNDSETETEGAGFSDEVLFPRPRQQRQLEEMIYLYFPVDEGGPSDRLGVALPGEFEAIFSPPEQMPLRSSATIRTEPSGTPGNP